MKKIVVALLVVASVAHAQQPEDVARRVGEDAIAIDRVAAASKRDLPTELLERMIAEDIELLRGRRNDGSYQYASFERFDSGRISDSFSVRHHGDRMEVLEVKGAWVYRVQVEVPSRRMVVRKNRPVWIERVEVEYVAERGSATERQTMEVKQWLAPGEFRPLDLPAIARQATVRVVASVEKEAGYGNLEVTLIKARIVDNADSPYADAVASAKAVQRALENGDVPSLRSMAQRMRTQLLGENAARASARAAEDGRDGVKPVATSEELRAIEDLLTGNEQERREGMDRLRQLIRRLRQ